MRGIAAVKVQVQLVMIISRARIERARARVCVRIKQEKLTTTVSAQSQVINVSSITEPTTLACFIPHCGHQELPLPLRR